MRTRRNPEAKTQLHLAPVSVYSISKLFISGMDSLEAFTARRIAQFRVPFKVPFNTVPEDPQVTSKSGGPTKAEPSRDSNNVLEDIHIDLVDEDESEEALPCGSESGLKCGDRWLNFSLSSLASPLSLTDHEVDLDVSFSQKIPVSFIPYETTLDHLTVLSHRQRTGTPHTENFGERCARFSCTTLGVMIDGTSSSRCHRMRRQGMWGWKNASRSSPVSLSRLLNTRPRRSAVLSSAAKELEFYVHSMSSSQAGYATRSKSAVNSVGRLARDEAWALEQGGGGGSGDKAHEDEWDVVALLRRACLRVEEGKGTV